MYTLQTSLRVASLPFEFTDSLTNCPYYILTPSYLFWEMIVVFLLTTFWIKLRNLLHSLTIVSKFIFNFTFYLFLSPPPVVLSTFTPTSTTCYDYFKANSSFFSSIIFFISSSFLFSYNFSSLAELFQYACHSFYHDPEHFRS